MNDQTSINRLNEQDQTPQSHMTPNNVSIGMDGLEQSEASSFTYVPDPVNSPVLEAISRSTSSTFSGIEEDGTTALGAEKDDDGDSSIPPKAKKPKKIKNKYDLSSEEESEEEEVREGDFVVADNDNSDEDAEQRSRSNLKYVQNQYGLKDYQDIWFAWNEDSVDADLDDLAFFECVSKAHSQTFGRAGLSTKIAQEALRQKRYEGEEQCKDTAAYLLWQATAAAGTQNVVIYRAHKSPMVFDQERKAGKSSFVFGSKYLARRVEREKTVHQFSAAFSKWLTKYKAEATWLFTTLRAEAEVAKRGQGGTDIEMEADGT